MKKLNEIYKDFNLISPDSKNYKSNNNNNNKEIIKINDELSFTFSKSILEKYKDISLLDYGNTSFSKEKTYYYEAYYSSMIEGIKLPKQTSLIKKEEGSALINSYKTLDNKEQIDHNTLFDLMETLSSFEGSIEKQSSKPRSYRNDRVGIYMTSKYLEPILVHEGLDSKDIKPSLEILFKLMNDSYSETGTLIYSSICHLIFEYIHPFFDGNGRIGRMLMFWQLRKSGETSTSAHMSALINSNRNKYYKSMRDSQKTKNLDYFISFMYNICLESYAYEIKLLDIKEEYELTEIQLSFMRTLFISGILHNPITYPGIKGNFENTYTRDSFNKMINSIADKGAINIDSTEKTHKYSLNE